MRLAPYLPSVDLLQPRQVYRLTAVRLAIHRHVEAHAEADGVHVPAGTLRGLVGELDASVARAIARYDASRKPRGRRTKEARP